MQSPREQTLHGSTLVQSCQISDWPSCSAGLLFCNAGDISTSAGAPTLPRNWQHKKEMREAAQRPPGNCSCTSREIQHVYLPTNTELFLLTCCVKAMLPSEQMNFFFTIFHQACKCREAGKEKCFVYDQ